MENEIYDEIRERYGDENISNEQIKKDITADYSDLVDLRNRIKNGTDDDTELYEEDHLTLDHILDYMELFMKIIKVGDFKNE